MTKVQWIDVPKLPDRVLGVEGAYCEYLRPNERMWSKRGQKAYLIESVMEPHVMQLACI